ncbi:MAG: hypothetical protein ACOWYE_04490 [Desulfatiglandales bacterium]
MAFKTFLRQHDLLGILHVLMAIAAGCPCKMMHMTSRKLAFQMQRLLIVALPAPIHSHFDCGRVTFGEDFLPYVTRYAVPGRSGFIPLGLSPGLHLQPEKPNRADDRKTTG